MNSKVLNRDFQHSADGCYQIEALGNHPNRAAGVVKVVDAASALPVALKTIKAPISKSPTKMPKSSRIVAARTSFKPKSNATAHGI